MHCTNCRNEFVLLTFGQASLSAFDDRWKNETNESAELSNTVVDLVMLAIDTSEPEARGALDKVIQQQRQSTADRHSLPDIDTDSNHWLAAFREEGHKNELADIFYTQQISETPCGEPDCDAIHRNFESSHIIYLDFPRNRGDFEAFELVQLLAQWTVEVIENEDDAHACERDSSHKKCEFVYRGITRPAKYIFFAFRRGYAGDVGILNHVTLPEVLDLADHLGRDTLPSRQQSRTASSSVADDDRVVTEGPKLYDLVGVNNWKDFHYIGYVRDVTSSQSGDWVMLNDLDAHASIKTPFEGFQDVSLRYMYQYCSSAILMTRIGRGRTLRSVQET